VSAGPARLGAVVIGRNEGERLVRCLESLRAACERVVYVDSGSTDASVAAARERGVEVVELDPSIPFTAARARNAGAGRLVARWPEVERLQFVDGDCEVVPGWLERGSAALAADARLAAVCGRLRERRPDATVYNLLCDMEWDGPIGEVARCGGIAMMRRAAFEGVGGFREDLIAGEEPELCVRLRLAGWRIERLDAEMARHDAAMTRFGQWWRRSVRAGYTYAEGAWLHGLGPTRHNLQQLRRALVFGGVLPAAAVAGALPTLGGSLLLLGAYPVSAGRAYRSVRRRGRTPGESALYAASCVLGKLPELQGALEFAAGRLRGGRTGLIEHKGPG